MISDHANTLATMSSIEMASKKKKKEKGPGSKKHAEVEVEVSRTSVSRKERIAAAKLPPGMLATSPVASPRGLGTDSPLPQRKNSIATLGGAAVLPPTSASGARRGSLVAAHDAKITTVAPTKDAKGKDGKQELSGEERAKLAERKRSGKAYLDELIKTSTLNRNNEDAIIETSKKTFSNFDETIRRKNLTMAILGTIVMFLVVVTLEYPWDEERAFYDRSLNSMHAVEVLCSIITAYLMYLVYDYYNLQVDLDRLKYRQKYRTPLWKTTYFFPFMCELVICFLHPVPWSNQRKMGMLAFMKLYLWVRVYRDYSAVYRWRQDAIDACDVSHGIPQFTSWLSIRTLFYKWPWYFVGVAVVLSLVLFSFMIYVVERETINESCLADPCNCPAVPGVHTCLNGFQITVAPDDVDPLRSCCHSPFKKLTVCLYYTAVTMTTVGYGDYATLSSWGRGISMWAAITGVCLSALLVTALLSEFSLTFSQKFAADFVLIKQLTIRERELAARLIQLWFRRLQINKGHYREGESRGLSLRMSGAALAERSHLPSTYTNIPGRCFGETYDEALMWAIKDFRQHRMIKEQTLTMDSEGGNGLYKTIVQVTRAYELMTQKIVNVELAQRRMQIILRKLVLLFARLPQTLDPTVLVPLGLSNSMIDQFNRNTGNTFGGSGGSAAGSSYSSHNENVGASSDSLSDRDSAGGAAQAQMNAEAQRRIQQLEQQLAAKSNQLQKLQQAEATLQRNLEDLNKRLQNSQERTQKVIEAARRATSTQGPLRYRAISAVIPGLESVAVGGQLRNHPEDEAVSEAGATTSATGPSTSVSEPEESKVSSMGTKTTQSQGPSISRTSIVLPTTIANAVTGGNPSAILAIRTEAPSAEELNDPDGEWEEVIVPESALQEVNIVPLRPQLAPGVTRMTFGGNNNNNVSLGNDEDDEEEDIDGSQFLPNMSTGNPDRFY